MIYKAYLKQSGEGCDYTIGCAQTIIDIEAQSIDEAKQKLYQEIEESYTGEQELELCELYEINEVVICEAHLYPTSRNYDTGTAARKPLKPAWRIGVVVRSY